MSPQLHHIQAIVVTIMAVTALPASIAVGLLANSINDTHGVIVNIAIVSVAILLVGLGIELGILSWGLLT